MSEKAIKEPGVMEREVEIPQELPIIPLKNMVVFPYIITPLVVADEVLVRMVNDALMGDKMVALLAQKDPGKEQPSEEDIHSVGTAGTILKMFRVPDGSIRLLIQGISRIRLKRMTQSIPFLKGEVEPIPEVEEKTLELEALRRNVLSMFQRIVSLAPYLPDELTAAAMNVEEAGRLADLITANLNFELAEKQQLLEDFDVRERLERLMSLLDRELKVLELGNKIQSQVRSEMDKTQREYFLREQLKAIQRELGEADERTMEINELRQKIEEAQMPEEARKVAEKELDRLAKMPPAAAEYTVSRTYIDWLVSLPWQKSTEDNLDVAEAARILDEDHYDLDEVKERILEYLAVCKLKGSIRGPILCFVGPPGVGKTSLGMSIARALGRRFIRLSLGGMRDEAEIRGHRRTYVGAMPGRIIQSIRRVESNNPVFMLDEVDKVGQDFRGDPAAALLEVLDPEQNYFFSDHYLDVPFDLSKVMFITTANILDPIPPALRDRMEVLSLPGYVEDEKLMIAKKYLVPKQLEENGLSSEALSFTDGAIRRIISDYTKEAGLRSLEREIAAVCRKGAREVAEGQEVSVRVTAEQIPEYLGPLKFFSEVASRTDEVGVATGVAWTQTGGELLFIESTKMRGGRTLTLTGQMGEVMQESARAALSYVRSKAKELNILEDFFRKNDIHIHVPAGAIPKDGPSAGVAIATSLASLLTERPVKHNVAMSGEITLQGRVLPVGGIKEKILAARRAGIKTLILPELNQKDLEKVPEHIRKELNFIFVDRIDGVWESALMDGKA